VSEITCSSGEIIKAEFATDTVPIDLDKFTELKNLSPRGRGVMCRQTLCRRCYLIVLSEFLYASHDKEID
jgi:hypothetical protein